MTGQQVQEEQRPRADALLRVNDVHKSFRVRGRGRASLGVISAVDGASFEIREGQSLGIVGESGSGKSTVARIVVRLLEPDSGSVEFLGEDITHAGARRLSGVRKDMQLVAQDPYSSLDPRLSVGMSIGEPLEIMTGMTRRQITTRVHELMDSVGLRPGLADVRPSELSGGQRQRACIARAISLHPKLLVLDEPTSSLDVSVQAQVLNLLKDLQAQYGLTYLFISHDLSVVSFMCDQLAVMYMGRLVEAGSKDRIFRAPIHPYSQALLSALPVADPEQRGSRQRMALRGELASSGSALSGCRFRARCWKATDKCLELEPDLLPLPATQGAAACHFPEPLDVLSLTR